jgi:hypothetical protein
VVSGVGLKPDLQRDAKLAVHQPEALPWLNLAIAERSCKGRC